MFNYCWWKGHFVGRTSESGISESDFLVLGCLTKSACNPLENFTVLALPDHRLSSELKMAHSAKKTMSTWGNVIQAIHINHHITCVTRIFEFNSRCWETQLDGDLPTCFIYHIIFYLHSCCWCQKTSSYYTQTYDTTMRTQSTICTTAFWYFV